LKKKYQIENALNESKLQNYFHGCAIREIASFEHKLKSILWYWLGTPNLERIEEIRSNNIYLTEFIDFEIVKKRLEYIEEIENPRQKKEEYNSDIFGLHLTLFFPELVETRNHLSAIIEKLPKGVEKGELWLILSPKNLQPLLTWKLQFILPHKENFSSKELN
jgi:hypothetical protein